MLIDEGVLVRQRHGWRVAKDPRGLPLPPTITALLVARLDRLPPDERLLIERAAVIGEAFSTDALEALVDPGEAGDVERLLRELERKELVRSRPPRREGEAEWRFGHILVRDAAYAGLPKLARARLHERAARKTSGALASPPSPTAVATPWTIVSASGAPATSSWSRSRASAGASSPPRPAACRTISTSGQ